MTSEHRFVVLLLILTLALAVVRGSAAAQAAPGRRPMPQLAGSQGASGVTVRVDPEVTTEALDDAFDVIVRIEDVEGLAGYRFELTYDPQVVSVVDVEDGGFVTDATTFGPDYPAAGIVSFQAVILKPRPQGVDGSGALAAVHLRAEGLGTSDLQLGDIGLFISGEDGPQDPDATADGFVEVVPCSEAQITDLALAPDSVQAGQPLTLTANVTGTTPITYAWSFGDGAPGQTGSELDQVTHTYTAPGSYTVTLDVGNCSGQGMDAVEQEVTVEERPCQAVSIDALSVSPTAAFAGQELAFQATLSGDAPITTIWAFGDGTPKETATDLDQVIHIYEQAGAYTVTLTAENCRDDGPYTDVATRTLTVEEPCDLAVIDLDSDSPAALGDPIRFTAAVTGSQPITYTWDFGDGSPLDVGVGMDVVTHTYAATGTFQVDLTVENDCGQEHAVTPAVVVEHPLILSIVPQDVTPFSGQVFTVAVTIEGAEDLGGYGFVIRYEPGVVDVLKVEDGGFLGQEGRQVLPVGPTYPTTTTVEFSAASLRPPEGGVDGDGPLAILTLKAMGEGVSPLDLVDDAVSLLMTTSDDPVQPTAINDGTVVVEGYRLFLPIVLRSHGP